ncbi:MAG TPA: hypothetical protein VNQ79_08780 [Blastocatellia bacterium]|nr:hypothetical protein [Blastocatellia bacterium]
MRERRKGHPALAPLQLSGWSVPPGTPASGRRVKRRLCARFLLTAFRKRLHPFRLMRKPARISWRRQS